MVWKTIQPRLSFTEAESFKIYSFLYFLQSIIFYCVRNKKVLEWINNTIMMSQLDELKKQSYIDLDTIFRPSTDKDYDLLSGGVTRQSFCKNYQEWLVCCNNRREPGEVLSSYFL